MTYGNQADAKLYGYGSTYGVDSGPQVAPPPPQFNGLSDARKSVEETHARLQYEVSELRSRLSPILIPSPVKTLNETSPGRPISSAPTSEVSAHILGALESIRAMCDQLAEIRRSLDI